MLRNYARLVLHVLIFDTLALLYHSTTHKKQKLHLVKMRYNWVDYEERKLTRLYYMYSCGAFTECNFYKEEGCPEPQARRLVPDIHCLIHKRETLVRMPKSLASTKISKDFNENNR